MGMTALRTRKKEGKAGAAEKNGGFVLVLVLLVLAVLLALAVDFAYAVYVNVSGLHNLDTLQALSTEGSSLIDSSGNYLLQALAQGTIPVDGENITIPLGDGTTVNFLAGDENAKFNLNTIVQPNGNLNRNAYQSFRRLLNALHLDASIADKVAYWINPAAASGMVTDGKTKRGYLDSTQELQLFIDEASYDTLKNYVTVYGDGLININTAQAPVLMSLSDNISQDLAERVIERRKLEPFQNIGQLSQVAGFESLGMQLAPEITVSSSAISITASAEKDGLVRTVDGVMDTSGKILFWREN